MKQTVSEEDRNAFRKHYQQEIVSLRTYSPLQRRQRSSNLKKKGFAALEIRNPELYTLLGTPEYTMCQRGKQEVARFIMRLGCYEEYRAKKAEAHASLFTRFRNYTQSITHSIAQWFGGETKTQIA